MYLPFSCGHTFFALAVVALPDAYFSLSLLVFLFCSFVSVVCRVYHCIVYMQGSPDVQALKSNQSLPLVRRFTSRSHGYFKCLKLVNNTESESASHRLVFTSFFKLQHPNAKLNSNRHYRSAVQTFCPAYNCTTQEAGLGRSRMGQTLGATYNPQRLVHSGSCLTSA
ncbi:hypothetical protein BS17DRAFT_187217 [Gyrodon lividus]|nr:hypothetical protein BS17DRAFT_187217 [Gyrodon lividus]